MRWTAWKKKRYLIPIALLILIAASYLFNSFTPVQSGLAFAGPVREAQQVRFLSDLSWREPDGTRRVEQQIFDEVLTMIRDARRFILIDMFLFNDFQGPSPETTRALSAELTAALIAKKNLQSDIQITLITDPINTVYGGVENEQLTALADAGVAVVLTDLSQLRHSNPVYSFFWHWFIRPFGNRSDGTSLPNPFGAGRVTWRSYLALLNLKANHRKILVADQPDGEYSALVMSANPHDASSAHRNVALRFSGAAAIDIIEAENAVLALSGSAPIKLPAFTAAAPAEATIQVLTEARIKQAILALLNQAGAQHRLRLLLFYLSDRDIIAALVAAAQRGVDVQVILDVNRDAFGHKKNGIPNRAVASELVDHGIKVRWCDTSGEQCHAKMLLLASDSEFVMLQGSANFTRRNLDNFNLETDVLLVSNQATKALTAAMVHFEQLWRNANERSYTVAYDAHQDESVFKKWLYRIMEASGLSSF